MALLVGHGNYSDAFQSAELRPEVLRQIDGCRTRCAHRLYLLDHLNQLLLRRASWVATHVWFLMIGIWLAKRISAPFTG